MRGFKILFAAVFILCLSIPPQSICAVTLNYTSTAQALAQVAWHDYYGYYLDGDFDSDQDINEPSYASAYYDRIQYAGEVGISASAGASIDPNKVTLSTSIDGSYYFDVGWDLLDYFYQDANSTLEGYLQITEFPAGTPCALDVNILFPAVSWTGMWGWQIYIESSLEYLFAGSFDDDGPLSGTITAYAGEPIYVFFEIAGRGYADHEIGDHLGGGTRTINVVLTPTPHPADFIFDGSINFQDFAVFSSQWLRQGCSDPNKNWCRKADFDRSGQIDVNDLGFFARYWLLHPDPNQLR